MISSTGVAIAGVTANSREKLFSGRGGGVCGHGGFSLHVLFVQLVLP